MSNTENARRLAAADLREQIAKLDEIIRAGGWGDPARINAAQADRRALKRQLEIQEASPADLDRIARARRYLR